MGDVTDSRDPLSTDALDVVVQLLFELGDAGPEPGPFHDRICEAVCRLTSMQRAVLFLYDEKRKLVLPAGSYGVEHEILAHAYGTLEETPIAQRALSEDEVLETDDLGRDVPSRYASIPGIVKLTCTPVAAAGRWLGVIFAERDGQGFKLSEQERLTMRALGRTAALATHVGQAAVQRERSRLLLERVELAREVHERVMQRLFGVSMVLGTDDPLGEEDRKRSAAEIESALGELRSALARSLEPTTDPPQSTLRAELQRLGRQYKHLPLTVTWGEGVDVPPGLEPLALSVLTEALRNAEKHAHPTEVWVTVGRSDGAFALEVRNDGLVPGQGDGSERGVGSGLGLRLAAYEALQRGGMLEFGAEDDNWRVRLVLPSENAEGVPREGAG